MLASEASVVFVSVSFPTEFVHMFADMALPAVFHLQASAVLASEASVVFVSV
jgi:hypothetical protein